MTPDAVIRGARADGVIVGLSPTGGLKVSGNGILVRRWTPELIANKAGILALLERKAEAAPEPKPTPAGIAADLEAKYRAGGSLTLSELAALAMAEAKAAPKVPAVRSGAHGWWKLHYPDGEVVELACTPPATYGEIWRRYPGAKRVEHFTPTVWQPSSPMTSHEVAVIRAWLERIGEPAAGIADAIAQCEEDTQARECYLGLAQDKLTSRTVVRFCDWPGG